MQNLITLHLDNTLQISELSISLESKDIWLKPLKRIQIDSGFRLNHAKGEHYDKVVLFKQDHFRLDNHKVVNTRLHVLDLNTLVVDKFWIQGDVKPFEFVSEKILICQNSNKVSFRLFELEIK